MKHESCNFVQFLGVARRGHGGIGGKGDCGGEGDSNRRRRRRGGGREGDGLPAGARALAWARRSETNSSARTELKSAKFLATASGHLKA